MEYTVCGQSFESNPADLERYYKKHQNVFGMYCPE